MTHLGGGTTGLQIDKFTFLTNLQWVKGYLAFTYLTENQSIGIT